MMIKPASVDAYIANVSSQMQKKLQELRALIKTIVPQAEEKISYGMPYYAYKGRLVYFALMKNHIGLYIPPPIIEKHKDDLRDYTTTKSAVHLPVDKELPKALITKLIQSRVAWNSRTT